MLRKFTFAERKTDFLGLLHLVSELFDQSGGDVSSSSGAPLQLLLVISDGAINENQPECRTMIRQMAERGRLCASVVVDKPNDDSGSILDWKVCMARQVCMCVC